MSDEETKIINDPRSFEEKVLAQLDDLRSRVAETRSGFEGFVGEFQNMKDTIKMYFDNFDEKLEVINSELLQVKADQRKVERRVRKLEAEDRPQILMQDKQF